MSSPARQTIGRAGEELACEHLARFGFEILQRNYRSRFGELDVIAFDGRTLVFCEVKARRWPGRAGRALEAIDARKRAQVRRIARQWLHEHSPRPRPALLRFDAIGVTFDRAGALVALEHLEGAF